MLKFALYISNHGYGHATRMAALAEEFIKFGVFIYIRSARPDFIFQSLNTSFFRKDDVITDVGVKHGTNLEPDLNATRSALIELMSDRLQIIDREVEFLRSEKIDLIITDIPWLVVEAGTYGKVPVFAISNFDWLFIYERLFAGYRDTKPILNTIFGLYQRIDVSFRLPLSSTKSMSACRNVVKTGLLAQRKASYANIRETLHLEDDKPILLCSFGGEGPLALDMDKLCAAFPGYVISAYDTSTAKNHYLVRNDVDYLDLMHGCDVILTKPGYSSFAEAMQFGKFIVYIPRTNYPEEQILIGGIKRYPHQKRLDAIPRSVSGWKAVFRDVPMRNSQPKKLTNNNTAVCCEILRHYFKFKYPGSKLVSVFDAGSNNINYALFAAGTSQPIHTTQVFTGLGRDYSEKKDGSISVPARSMAHFKRAVSSLASYDACIPSLKHVIATGIHRNLVASDRLSEWFRSKWDLPYRIISEREELTLAYLAAKELTHSGAQAVIVDIGGFSTELVFMSGNGSVEFQSLPLGLLKIRKHRLEGKDTNHLISGILESTKVFKADTLIGLGLTFTFLAKVIKGQTAYSPATLHGMRISRTELEDFSQNLDKNGTSELHDLLMEPQSLDVLRLSVAYLILLLDRFGCSEILVCYYGISKGYYQWTKQAKPRSRIYFSHEVHH